MATRTLSHFRFSSRFLVSSTRNWREQLIRHVSDSTSGRKDRLLDSDMGTTDTEQQSSMVTLISLQDGVQLFITKYSSYGFTLNNGLHVPGPSVFFPTTCFSWKIRRFEDINADSLSLMTTIAPKLDVLVIGTGLLRRDIDMGLVKMLREKRINFDVLSTNDAIATFNFVNNDQRWVAAALIPPEPINVDIAQRTKRRLEEQLDDAQLDMEEVDTGSRSLLLEDAKKKTVRVADRLAERNDLTTTLPKLRQPLGQGGDIGENVKIMASKDSAKQLTGDNQLVGDTLSNDKNNQSEDGTDSNDKR